MKRKVLPVLILCLVMLVSCTPQPVADPVIFGEIITLVDDECLFYGMPIWTSSEDISKAFPDWHTTTTTGKPYTPEEALELSRTFMGADMRVTFYFDPDGRGFGIGDVAILFDDEDEFKKAVEEIIAQANEYMPEPEPTTTGSIEMVNNSMNVFWKDANGTQIMILAKDEYAGEDISRFKNPMPRYQIYVSISARRIGFQFA